MKTKICSKCKNKKSLSKFYKDKTKKDGYGCMCKSCIKPIKREYGKTYRKLHKKEIKQKSRGYQLKHRYNITEEDYDNMYIKQHGCCAICGKHQSELSKRFHVDHCHITGNIRQLLCMVCNTNLGWFEIYKDKIINYLKP